MVNEFLATTDFLDLKNIFDLRQFLLSKETNPLLFNEFRHHCCMITDDYLDGVHS